MSDNQRYIRQTSLSQFGTDGQRKLKDSRVLVVGLGGLGLPAAQYLNAMGVGTLGVVEQDIVELHNLQRQILYSEADVGKPKLVVAVSKLKQQNSETTIIEFDTFLTKENALEIISDFDLVVDATDNFATRYLINDACIIQKKPFVYGALHAFEGQVSVFNYKNGPTYRCLFPTPPNQNEIPNCDENGVLGVVPGIVGTLQALEAVKVLTGVGEVLSGKLLVFDGLTQSFQKISFKTNPSNKKLSKLKDSYGDSTCKVIPEISTNEFVDLIDSKALQIVDVRLQEEFETEHLPMAKNIPLSLLELSLDTFDWSKPIYLVCQSGQRSKRAGEVLLKNHPEAQVFNVVGGMNAIKSHAGAH